MQEAVKAGKKGLAFYQKDKKSGKPPEDYSLTRWEKLFRTNNKSKPWAHVQAHICEEFKPSEWGVFWLFEA